MSRLHFYPPLPPRLRRAVRAARLAVWLEAAWAVALALPAAALGLYLLAAASGLAALLPGAVRVPLLALLLAALAGALAHALRTIGPISPARVRRRLERAARLPAGRLAPLFESPAPLPSAPGLWARAQSAALRAPLRWPVPLLSKPAAPAFVLGAGVAAAAAAALIAPERLAAAFSPHVTDLSAASVALVIEPPAYTGADLNRIKLRLGEEARVAAPAGSRVRAAQYVPDGPWRLEAEGTRWVIRYGSRRFARLDLQPIADRPPRVAWAGEPRQSAQGALGLGYTLEDDHDGLTLALEFVAAGSRRQVPLGEALPRGPGRAVADLGSEPMPEGSATMTLVVRDAAGQEARSKPVRLTLRPRLFRDPLARAIVAARAALLAAPRERMPVVSELDRLSGRAAVAGPPAATFPALRSAAYRLRYDERPAAIPAVAQLLWDAAVARDGGVTGDAAESLLAALDRLAKALAGQQAGDSAGSAAAELEAALARFLQAMAEAQQQPGRQPAPGGQTIMVDAGALLEMAREIAERQAAGDREGAEQLLQALRQAVEGLRLAGPGQAPGAEPGPPQPQGFDPLGRPGAGFAGGRVELLDPARAENLEEIRKTLRERSADPERPAAERNYYRRLIDRF